MSDAVISSNWLDGSWDRIYIDGELLIGRVAGLDINPKRDVQKSQKPGTDGSKLKDQGYEGAPIVLTQEVFRAADAQRLGAQIARLSPQQPGGIANPFMLSHPLCTISNVLKAYVLDIKYSMPKNGRWPVVITMAEAPIVIKPTKQGTGKGPGDNGKVPPEEWIPTGTPEEIQKQLAQMKQAIDDLYPDPQGAGAAGNM